jgi:hypothetical protein
VTAGLPPHYSPTTGDIRTATKIIWNRVGTEAFHSLAQVAILPFLWRVELAENANATLEVHMI